MQTGNKKEYEYEIMCKHRNKYRSKHISNSNSKSFEFAEKNMQIKKRKHLLKKRKQTHKQEERDTYTE
jgi:hypothetical protein